MNFYTQQHKHYCGIDLHARAMYVCILDQHGTKLVHKNLPTTPEAFLRVIAPYREDLVVGVECMFTWYWLADLCQKEGIAFVLGHALYMKAIHGGKAKNDKIDAQKITVLLRGDVPPSVRLSCRDAGNARLAATPVSSHPQARRTLSAHSQYEQSVQSPRDWEAIGQQIKPGRCRRPFPRSQCSEGHLGRRIADRSL